MKNIIKLIISILGIGVSNAEELNYDHAIHLDAEELAEGGINKAIKEVQSEIDRKNIAVKLAAVKESSGEIGSIEYKDKVIIFFDAKKESNDHLWPLATYALFYVVNMQLKETGYLLYAVNGGNDLVGFILSEKDYKSALETKNLDDRPYIPTDKAPMFGCPVK